MGWCCSGLCGALALVALLCPPGERGCCWGLEPSSGDPETSPHSDPDPREALQRHKRSWVWNQFFVLEEYTGNEPLYVGKVSALRLFDLQRERGLTTRHTMTLLVAALAPGSVHLHSDAHVNKRL